MEITVEKVDRGERNGQHGLFRYCNITADGKIYTLAGLSEDKKMFICKGTVLRGEVEPNESNGKIYYKFNVKDYTLPLKSTETPGSLEVVKSKLLEALSVIESMVD